jgi:isochorismate synthase
LFSVRFELGSRDVLPDFMAACSRDAFFWQEPSQGVSLLGLGRVATLEAVGPKRFGETSAHARELFRDLHLHSIGEDVSKSDEVSRADYRGPLLVGGYGFYDRDVEGDSEWADFGAGRLVLPELGVVVRGEVTFATRTCWVEAGDAVDSVIDRLCADLEKGVPVTGFSDANELPKSWDENSRGPEIRVQADRPHGRYLAQVTAALAAIDAGKFEKVVLARSLEVRAEQDFDLGNFLSCLREIYPACTTLAVREGDSWFISATPERLVSLHDGRVSTAAVAGSAPRGRSHDEEEQHSALLKSSEKERLEHELVKRAIREALIETCGPLEGPDEPRLLKLEGIQHLETPLEGQLLPKWQGELGVLDLVSALHPTPAVGGVPSTSALDWLERCEDLDRGWYAGPVGYVDGKGDGEFRVALRSALLRGSRARLFAGAGIVAGSEPERELAETRLKLRTLLAPLTEI